MNSIIQRSIAPSVDLREMLREHLIARSLFCMEQAAKRRELALFSAEAFQRYQQTVRQIVQRYYGELPVGVNAPVPTVIPVSRYDCDGFYVENVLFDSFPGWQVNATVYVPSEYKPPFPAVVVPVGHSNKLGESYQLPCQYFARSGFLAICFDPPGQAGEKQVGNDHFNDGVRDYLLGETSSRYFLADALRCIDYLATREDVDLSQGVAMTGVSGGGTTTTFAALLDNRITVIGPSCCVTQLADLDIGQCYAGCPETHQWGRYADGIDEVDLLCAAVPTPCLLMAGAKDEVFHIEDTKRLADLVATTYTKAGVADQFEFYVDAGGHAYSLAQARRFTRFMATWLCNDRERTLPDLQTDSFALLPSNKLQCGPRQDVNMQTRSVTQAEQLAAKRDSNPDAIRVAASKLACVSQPLLPPDAELGEPFLVWSHYWHSVMLRPEPGIELPATLLTSSSNQPAPTILHFDDRGRHRLLYRQGLLAGAIGFIARDQAQYNLMTVDVRGWGDTAPAMYPYEIAGWGSIDRYLAYTSAALLDPILAMRIRDGLATLAWLRTRAEVSSAKIVLSGSGLGAVVALHIGAIDNAVAGVVLLDGLSSFQSLLSAEQYPWPADAFFPGVLRHYDLPQLAAVVSAPVHVYGLQDGAGNIADGSELWPWQEVPHVSIMPDTTPALIAQGMKRLLTQIQ